MSNNPFAGLETLDVKDEVVVNDEMMADALELLALDEELQDSLMEVQEVLDIAAGEELTINTITNLHDVVAEHGLCKSMMLAVDPERTLEKHLSFEYDSLDASPISDDVATAALEDFKGTMKKWGDAIRKFFKMIWEKIKGAVNGIVQFFTKYESVLKNLEAKLKDVKDVDAKKEAKLVDAGTLKKLGSAISAVKFASDPKSLSAEYQKLLGLKVENGELVSDKSEIKAEKKSLGDLGYKSASDVLGLISEAKGVLAAMKSAGAAQKAVENASKAAEAELKSLEAAEGKPADEIKAMKDKVAEQQKAAKSSAKLLAATTKASKMFLSNVVSAANAVAAAGK